MTKYIDLLRAHQKTKKSDDISPLCPLTLKATNVHLPDEEKVAMFTETPLQADEFKGFIDEVDLTDQAHVKAPVDDVTLVEPIKSELNHDSHILKNNVWLRECIRYIQVIFEKAEKNEVCDIHALSKHIQYVLERLKNDSDQQIMDALELNISQQTQYIRECHKRLGGLIQKSILMMLYTIKTGERLKLSPSHLHTHIMASMLHHIGMTQISNDIRNKKERLSKAELKEIYKAPRLGFEYLKMLHVEDDIILDACLFANERYDGSKATGLLGSNIAWSARLTGVLSMFEALIHYRPYRNRLLPRDAIREIVKNHKKAFDPDMLKALIESISLYPIGTYAQLNTGEIGLVIHIHPYRPLRPVVDIRMDRHGNTIPVRKVDLTTQPNLTVERCMYEEATLKLAKQQG